MKFSAAPPATGISRRTKRKPWGWLRKCFNSDPFLRSIRQPQEGGAQLSSGLCACEARSQRFQPRTKLVNRRGKGACTLLGVVGALAQGRGLVAGLGQTVGKRQRGHDDETLIADLAERLAHLADLLIDQAG